MATEPQKANVFEEALGRLRRSRVPGDDVYALGTFDDIVMRIPVDTDGRIRCVTMFLVENRIFAVESGSYCRSGIIDLGRLHQYDSCRMFLATAVQTAKQFFVDERANVCYDNPAYDVLTLAGRKEYSLIPGPYLLHIHRKLTSGWRTRVERLHNTVNDSTWHDAVATRLKRLASGL